MESIITTPFPYWFIVLFVFFLFVLFSYYELIASLGISVASL